MHHAAAEGSNDGSRSSPSRPSSSLASRPAPSRSPAAKHAHAIRVDTSAPARPSTSSPSRSIRSPSSDAVSGCAWYSARHSSTERKRAPARASRSQRSQSSQVISDSSKPPATTTSERRTRQQWIAKAQVTESDSNARSASVQTWLSKRVPSGATRTQPHTAASTPCEAACNTSSAVGESVSSASRNSSHSPRARSIPKFRAADTPRAEDRSSRTRSSPKPDATAAVPSDDPFSTTIASNEPNVCAASDSSARASVPSASRAGITTDTTGTSPRMAPTDTGFGGTERRSGAEPLVDQLPGDGQRRRQVEVGLAARDRRQLLAREPAHVVELVVTGGCLAAGVGRVEAEHQRHGERPRLRGAVEDVADLHARLLQHLALHRLLERLARLDEAGQRRV